MTKKSTSIARTRKTDESKDEDHPIDLAIKNLFDATGDYRQAAISVLPSVAKKLLSDLKKNKNRLKKYNNHVDGEGNIIVSEAHEVKEILDILNENEELIRSKILSSITRSFYIGLFSNFDSFIGELLKGIYSKKPDLFNKIKREIPLNELVNYSSIEEIKKDILEEEIDSFRRDSYILQFSALETTFNIKTLKDFPEWPEFVECSQRRNLITHNDGKVNQQYLTIINKEKYNHSEKPKIGDALEIDPEYLLKSIFLINKVGFMLAHTLWKKVLPEEVKTANDCMNNSIYYLLNKKRWRMAAEIGCFALNEMMAKNIESMTKMIRVVNTSIALKNSKQETEAFKLLDSVDWSASIREFKLANAVLKDNYTEAANIMGEIGKKGELIDEVSYYRWPLFETFRGSQEFQDAFFNVYSKPFKDQLAKDIETKFK